jgi:hypothetical protein
MKDQAFALGQIMVSTTENTGHTAEFWAEQITKKICGISVNAAPHVRMQAEAFRNDVYKIVLHGVKNAISSDRVTIRGCLSDQGHDDMAKIIKEL